MFRNLEQSLVDKNLDSSVGYHSSKKSFFKLLNVYINTDSVGDTVMAYSILTSACKQPRVLFEIHKIDFRGKKKHTKRGAK